MGSLRRLPRVYAKSLPVRWLARLCRPRPVLELLTVAGELDAVALRAALAEGDRTAHRIFVAGVERQPGVLKTWQSGFVARRTRSVLGLAVVRGFEHGHELALDALVAEVE